MDHIAMAETLEAQAASLRREHARLAQEGQAELPLGGEWREWGGCASPPTVAEGKVVDIELRNGDKLTGPASAYIWTHDGPGDIAGDEDIVRYRIAAEQPAST